MIISYFETLSPLRPHHVLAVEYSKRRGRDSNPRRANALGGFQDRRYKPLTHLSLSCK